MQNLNERQVKAKSLIFNTLDPFRQGPHGQLILLSQLPAAIARPGDVQEAFDTLFEKGGIWDDRTWDGGDGRIVYWCMDEEQEQFLFPKNDKNERIPRKNAEEILPRCTAWVQENRCVVIPREQFAKIVETVDLEVAKQDELNRRAESVLVGREGSTDGAFPMLVKGLSKIGYLPEEKARAIVGFAQNHPVPTRMFIDSLLRGIATAADDINDGGTVESVSFNGQVRRSCGHTEEEHGTLHGLVENLVGSFLDVILGSRRKD